VQDRYSYLLRNPVSLLSTSFAFDVPRILEEASCRQREGFAVAGYVSYEAGFSLDSVFSPIDAIEGDFPLVWFGIYPGFLRFDHLLRRWKSSGTVDWPEEERADPPPPDGCPTDPWFSFTETEYGIKVEEIRRDIAAGQYYQANLTGNFSFRFPGDPFSLYRRLQAIQPVRYGAFLRTDAGCILSQSPELFFRVRGRNIDVQPMKGTAARGRTEGEDRRAAAALKSDPKNRAENVMIVDLMRNDLGKCARSVPCTSPVSSKCTGFAPCCRWLRPFRGRSVRERPPASCSTRSSRAAPSRGRPRSPPCGRYGALNLRPEVPTRARSGSCCRAGA
jgi:para-aminobenzoate synthetase/4-amino-4-deoxychorismate lyase